jgi:hypothetical protein
MSALLILAAAAAMPPAFHGDWAKSAAACREPYARRSITATQNTEGDYWGVVKSVKAISAQQILVQEGDDDFGVGMTAQYTLSADRKALTLHVLERNGAKVSEMPIALVRCEAVPG